jgi:hypothetical protein
MVPPVCPTNKEHNRLSPPGDSLMQIERTTNAFKSETLQKSGTNKAHNNQKNLHLLGSSWAKVPYLGRGPSQM